MSKKSNKFTINADNISNLALGDNVTQHNIGDKIMGDKIDVNTGDISNASGQLFIGKFNDVVANLNAAGQTELAEALEVLREAVMTSEFLTDNDKQQQVEIINQIGEEASKPKPNKSMLKMLGDGLISTLKTIPDIAKAVGSVAPLLVKLYSL